MHIHIVLDTICSVTLIGLVHVYLFATVSMIQYVRSTVRRHKGIYFIYSCVSVFKYTRHIISMHVHKCIYIYIHTPTYLYIHTQKHVCVTKLRESPKPSPGCPGCCRHGARLLQSAVDRMMVWGFGFSGCLGF